MGSLEAQGDMLLSVCMYCGAHEVWKGQHSHSSVLPTCPLTSIQKEELWLCRCGC